MLGFEVERFDIQVFDCLPEHYVTVHEGGGVMFSMYLNLVWDFELSGWIELTVSVVWKYTSVNV